MGALGEIIKKDKMGINYIGKQLKQQKLIRSWDFLTESGSDCLEKVVRLHWEFYLNGFHQVRNIATGVIELQYVEVVGT